jgi:hypothetical protein
VLVNLQHKDDDNNLVKDNCWKETGGKWQGRSRGTACEWQGVCELAFNVAGEWHGLCKLALREQLEVITFHVNKYRTYQTKKFHTSDNMVWHKKSSPSHR